MCIGWVVVISQIIPFCLHVSNYKSSCRCSKIQPTMTLYLPVFSIMDDFPENLRTSSLALVFLELHDNNLRFKYKKSSTKSLVQKFPPPLVASPKIILHCGVQGEREDKGWNVCLTQSLHQTQNLKWQKEGEGGTLRPCLTQGPGPPRSLLPPWPWPWVMSGLFRTLAIFLSFFLLSYYLPLHLIIIIIIS